jgi:phage recombination protein Bet
MAGEVAVRENAVSISSFTPDVLKTLTESGIIPRGMPEANVKLFASVCRDTKLSPIKRQIYAVPRKRKDGSTVYNIQTGIDGYRAMAARTGLCAGIDDYKFDEGLSEFEHIKTKRPNPEVATVVVYKMVAGVRCPFSATARWSEYYPGDVQGFQWRKMPYLMLGKCAEALALRKAFPEEISGVYTDVEMAQADREEVKPAVATVKKEESDKPLFSDGGTDETVEMPTVPESLKTSAKTIEDELTDEEKAAIFGGEIVPPAPESAPEPPKAPPVSPADKRCISDPQRKRLYAICKSNGMTDEGCSALVAKYGYKHSKEILRVDYEKICEEAQLLGGVK